MIVGARQGAMSGLRRLVAASMAQEFGTFLIPGCEIARAHGLDITAAGIKLVASPRHASVLLVIGTMTPALLKAATVIYAQMMRPRVILSLGADDLSPLPPADVVAALSQQALIQGVRQIRTVFAENAFNPTVSDFDAPALQTRIEYTCPMHPDVVQNEPGSCPRCGMTLEPREAQASEGHSQIDHEKMNTTDGMHKTPTQGHNHHHDMNHDAPVKYTCPMHPETEQSEPGSCPKCGMNLEPREEQTDVTPDHHNMDHAAPIQYTCSMHPEIVQNEPGSCPKCGMTLVPREAQNTQHQNHADMDHDAMNHDEMAFMSMVDVTKDLPRSSDGLPMEWIDAPFGPFFPGLPSGLLLTLTLDGDTVVESRTQTLVENTELLAHLPRDTASFVEQLTGMDPLAPVAYKLLACQALENAAGMNVHSETARARAGALEQERIASHLGWLSLFGQQTGFDWLMQRAASLQLKFQHADYKQVLALRPALQSLIKRLQHTPLLKSRTVGIGQLTSDSMLRGPVARASGLNDDTRSMDKTYNALEFVAVNRKEGDAFARLHVRLDEMTHSLTLIETAGGIEQPALANIGDLSGNGESRVETSRGLARLQLTLKKGQVTAATLNTPSTSHLSLVNSLTAQQSLGDALMIICSLDLSPWEIQP